MATTYTSYGIELTRAPFDERVRFFIEIARRRGTEFVQARSFADDNHIIPNCYR